MPKDAVVLKKSNLKKWVNSMRDNYIVAAPEKGYRDFNFREVNDDTEYSLDYVRTVMPPKKFLHPTREIIMQYKRGEDLVWEVPQISKKTIVLGVHPCDARAILIYDKIFSGDPPDPYYWNHRENTIIIALSCKEPDEYCFCLTFNEEGPTLKDGYDLLMTDINDSYLIEVGTLEGSLLVQSELFKKASNEDFVKKEKSMKISRQKIRHITPDGEHLPKFLEKHYNSEIWEPEIQKCVSCGNCTMVCPTCFCYHVEDFNKWNTKDGKRVRMWDSCQLIDFSEVAMGENFRRDRGARLKWRIYHKLAYWKEQFGTYGCTGCGRCITFCIADIDMTRIIDKLGGII